MAARVLIVENERIVGLDMQRRLTSLGYEVPVVAASGEEALRQFDATQPDCVLMDIRIDGPMDGIDTATALAHRSSVPVVYLTAHSEDSTLERARKTVPYGYLIKPFTEREMHATLQMAIEHHRIEGAMRSSEERLRFALEAADMGIMDIDLESCVADISGRSAQIMGMGDAPVQASGNALLMAVDEADRAQVTAGLRACEENEAPVRLEFTRTGANDRRSWIRADARAVPGRGRRHRVVGVVQDITAQKLNEKRINQLNDELEQAVQDRTVELRASVEELGAFSYSVAHDLRAPLRAVLGFSQRLKEDFSTQLDNDGRSYVARVHAAGLRMSEVIDALLELARLNRVELRRERVNLSELVRQEATLLGEEQPQRQVEVIVDADVVVQADLALMRIVVDNLMRNAWKYTSKHPTARVEFGCEQGPGGPVYFVRDDGAGFENVRTGQLFVPFRRLHLARDFDGVGVGLATVQRIIHRHGGRITAEGMPEKGAKFSFTLGQVQPQPLRAASD